ncbi:solute carrier family 22 member 15-like [Tubulanus polymorphus]|uniref:solute carrier family 22 member 15-like n=1 Tax=Tubulanus polymorphus TaxID=672921 RepID=UPI003DA40D84
MESNTLDNKETMVGSDCVTADDRNIVEYKFTNGDVKNELVTTTIPEKKVFDDIYKVMGDVGYYHIMVYVFSQLIETSCAAAIMYFVFETADPQWTCSDTDYTTRIGNRTKMSEQERCDLGCANITYNGVFWSIVAQWDLICDRAYLAKLVGSLFFAGVLCGALIGGQLSDWFGRKRTMLVVWFLLICSQSCLCATNTFEVYVFLRTWVGIFSGGVICIAPIIAIEYLGPTRRTVACYRFGWKLGPLSIALMAFVFGTWRWLSLIVGLLTLPLFPFMIFFLPESARWLIQKKRTDDALYWLNKMARCNKRDPISRDLLVEIEQTERLRLTMTHKYSLIDLFRTRVMAKRTIVIGYAWFSVATVWYGILAHVGTMSGNLYLNASITAVGDTVVRWTSIFIIHWLGRRKSYTLYMGIGGIGMIMILIFDMTGYTAEHPLVQTYLALAAFILMGGGWGVINLQVTELFPTLLRNAAAGVGNVGARVASILSPQITLLAAFHKTIPYAILGIFSISSLVLMLLFIPETKNQPLPDELPAESIREMERNARRKQQQTQPQQQQQDGDCKNSTLLHQSTADVSVEPEHHNTAL